MAPTPSSSAKLPLLNILIDLSGTLHIADEPTPGAIKALARLQRFAHTRGRCNVRFCSNTTKESPDSLHSRLLRIGFEPPSLPSTSLLTSLQACEAYCTSRSTSSLLLLSESAQQLFRAADEKRRASASSTSAAPAHFYPSPSRGPAALDESERAALRRCSSVVIGLAPELMRSDWLDEAFRILSGEYAKSSGAPTPSSSAPPSAKLIATHRALYFRPASDAPLSMGPGAYVNALVSAARLRDVPEGKEEEHGPSEVLTCGKPSQAFFKLALEGCEGSAEGGEQRSFIIGDDIDADLGGGAITMGLERVLVKTGKYRPGDETRGSKAPEHVAESFAAWVDWFLEAEGGDGQGDGGPRA